MSNHPNLRNRNIRVDASLTLDGEATNWDPATFPRYEEAVRRVLNFAFSTHTGRAVRDAITRPLTICPWPHETTCNADARARVDQDAARRGHRMFWCGDVPSTPIVETGADRGGTGTGAGTNAFVRFTPRMFGGGGACTVQASQPGGRADEVLLHELVHAIRAIHATRDCSGLSAGYETFDEFAAVLITNMHASELHRPLRRNHQGFTHVIAPERYYNNPQHSAWTYRLCRQMPALTRRLSRIPYDVCRFNPLLTVY